MKIVYASRTGNVESIIHKLAFNQTQQIRFGDENIDEDFILFTYTDGYGDVPEEVDTFLNQHSQYLKGVIVSGNTGYGETYCKAGDVISKTYQVPCLYKFEDDGTDTDVENIQKIFKTMA